MSSRHGMLAAVLVMAACTKEGPVRPAGTMSGPAVARVMLWQGEPKIVTGAARLDAKEDLELQKADVIQTPVGSWLVLRILANDYVVKVDEDLSLPVKDLALLGAPPAGKKIEDQLSALVTAQELTEDRVTAYQNRKTAATLNRAPGAEESVKSKEEAPGEPGLRELKKSKAMLPPAAPAPAAAPLARREPAQDKAAANAEVAASGGGGLGQVSGVKEKEATEGALPQASAKPQADSDQAQAGGEGAEAHPPVVWSWQVVREGKAVSQKAPLPAALAEELKDPAALGEVAAAAWKTAGLAAPAADQLMLRVENSRITRVRLASGVPLPALLSLKNKPAEIGADGWIVIPVSLPKPAGSPAN